MLKDTDAILERLKGLRAADAPTHGGRVLSYVYDSGLPELDRLAAAAMELLQPVNGLDPTAFTSVAVMEREVIDFARGVLGGDGHVVGTVTSGGTESCLLAVKTARSNFRGPGLPRILAPSTVHAAFHKAAQYLGLRIELIPVDSNGHVAASAMIERMGADVALVVVSAPSYPHAAMDPVAEIAEAARARGIDCHVDACIGGWVLPFWDGLEPWDLRVPGVTSIAADLHKYGYAPKGVSVLLTRGRDRQRSQYFATTNWPGYPVVNSTLLGSKSAAPLAAAWAIVNALGVEGFSALAGSCARSTDLLRGQVAAIEGLRVFGDPTGPLFAVARDDEAPEGRRVDPHHWADSLRARGWHAQLQPGFRQSDGSRLPRTTHLTVTPATEAVLAGLAAVMRDAADEVRGVAGVETHAALAALGADVLPEPDSAVSRSLLARIGISDARAGLPERMAPVMALVEALPQALSERLLIELMATLVEPPES